jgi:hypothetical protein
MTSQFDCPSSVDRYRVDMTPVRMESQMTDFSLFLAKSDFPPEPVTQPEEVLKTVQIDFRNRKVTETRPGESTSRSL